jgi:hypothetical protein
MILGGGGLRPLASQPQIYVCMHSYQSEGWLDPHPVPAPDAHTHTHAHTLYLHAHMPMHSTPRTTTARRTKPGVEWGWVASSFPPPYCTQPDNDEVHYLTKICSTNLIYLHHPQADNNKKSACILVVGGSILVVKSFL